MERITKINELEKTELILLSKEQNKLFQSLAEKAQRVDKIVSVEKAQNFWSWAFTNLRGIKASLPILFSIAFEILTNIHKFKNFR